MRAIFNKESYISLCKTKQKGEITLNSLKQLKKIVIDNSTTNDWASARNEWEVIPGVREDQDVNTTCICSHPNLRYIYAIRNTKNGNILTPIGDICIHQFDSNTMTNDASNYLALYKLCQAADANENITLSTKYFSRKLLLYLYDNNAFQPSKFNSYNPWNDYNFMLHMFNKRSPLSPAQKKKVSVLIKYNIIPCARYILNP